MALRGVSFTVAEGAFVAIRSEEHTSELQSQSNIVCRLLIEKNIRIVDDFVIFAKRAEEAEAGLHFLCETLFHNHVLTLQTAKTRLFSRKDYKTEYLVPPSKK